MANSLYVDDVIINEQLDLRPRRPPRLAAEIRAFHRLMKNFSSDSETLMEDMLDIIRELCRADSAGITLEETFSDGSKGLVWAATVGKLGDLRGVKLSREHSPCGTVLDRRAPQLFSRPQRFFEEIDEKWNVVEILLVPWGLDSQMAGTFWLLSQTESCRFDREDLRLLMSLVVFAEAALMKERSNAKRRLRETNISMAHLANQLAHELNNPLQALTNSLYLLEPGPFPEHLANGKLQLDRVTEIVRAILKLGGHHKAPLQARGQTDSNAISAN